jgi:NAD(P)H dehydrogenase (quinone)
MDRRLHASYDKQKPIPAQSERVFPMYALTGANGQLGRLVLQHLLMLLPADQIIATTRNPHVFDDFETRGVLVRHADFTDPATLRAAFAGVKSLLIISTNKSGHRVEQHRAAVEAAVLAGVRHIVYTSCPEASAHASSPVQLEHGLTESALASSGVAWTALRNNMYTEALPYIINLLRIGDQLLIPEGQGKPTWITREDCARTAAFVVAGLSHFSGPVDVTGPERLGLTDIAQRYSSISGHLLTAHALPENEIIAQIMAKGVPAEVAAGVVGIASGIAHDTTSTISNIVEQATGTQASPVDGVLRFLAAS